MDEGGFFKWLLIWALGLYSYHVHVEFNILNEFFLKMFLIHLGYLVVDHTEAWG